MDQKFIARLFDKGISLFVFIFLLKQIVSYGADISLLFWGAIFGFIISLNQDLRIKNYIINDHNVGAEVSLSVFLNSSAFLLLVFFSSQSFLNISLFYFVASGRFDILKYESKFVGAQFQTAISLFVSLLFYLVITAVRQDAEILSVIFYMIFKSILGEVYLLSFLHRVRIASWPKFDAYLALSGSLVVSVGYVIPTFASYFVADPAKLLYHIAAIQRSLSPAQQIGTIYSKSYKNISEILQKIWVFCFVAVISTISIYSYLMSNDIDIIIIFLMSIISFYSTISGSWTITMIAQGRESIEMLKTITAIIFSSLLVPLLMLTSLTGSELVVSVYVAYLLFIYVPFIHFYR